MNTNTTKYLKEIARFVEKFRNLHPDEQEWLEPLLRNNVKTALNILDAISNTSLSYEEIANICELHPTTVKQMLSALSEGGCTIDMSEKTAFAPTGRPRTLARR